MAQALRIVVGMLKPRELLGVGVKTIQSASERAKPEDAALVLINHMRPVITQAIRVRRIMFVMLHGFRLRIEAIHARPPGRTPDPALLILQNLADIIARKRGRV